MLSKKEIKDIQSLSHKKFRTQLNLFVAEGPKIVTELLHAIPDQVEKVYATPEWIRTHPGERSSAVVEITEAELARISQLQTPNQALALIRQWESHLPDPTLSTIYLDTIQDPGNFGTIIRIADWFGLKQVVCSPGCADRYNLKVVQSTMASISRVNVFYDEEEQWLQQQKGLVYAAVLDGSSVYDAEKRSPFILVIGNESKGIRPELLPPGTKKITIPGKGAAESLNAAVATGIILSHLIS
jgi:RNA methyltransferase, TrmH family